MRNDVAFDGIRWLTARPPAQPDVEIVLLVPGGPGSSPADGDAIAELLAKGSCRA